MPKVVTANTLATGKVVFQGSDGAWVEAIAEARRYDDAAAAEEGLAKATVDVERAVVVEPFMVEAGAAEGGRPKMTLRDTIRAYGPTIRFMPDTGERA